MKYSYSDRGIPAGNPIANALVVVVGMLAIAASIVLGFVAFIVFGSIVLVLGSIVALRVWWFNRKLRRSARKQAKPDNSSPGGVIEGEYHVVKRDEKS